MDKQLSVLKHRFIFLPILLLKYGRIYKDTVRRCRRAISVQIGGGQHMETARSLHRFERCGVLFYGEINKIG